MSCLDEDAIAALLAGELDAAGLREAEVHLDACAECRRLVSELASDTTAADAPPTETSFVADVGLVVDDRFVVEAIAGRGGMGRVYRARDRHDGSIVALKRVDVDDARFAREAQILAELAHPAIVRHVADGRDGDGSRYLAMEWLEGEDLYDRLTRGPLSVGETIALGRRIAAALGAAHARGVVHRDIKPSNVVLPEGRVDRAKVVDFGLARASLSSGTRTRTGALLGTVGYMAPEQASGRTDVSPAADVFSLGCILYECLTGVRAFDGAHVVAILAKLLTRPPPRPRKIAPHVPRALDALVTRMLSRDPRDRPANGAEVEAALASLGTIRGLRTFVRPSHALPVTAFVGVAVLAAMGGTLLVRPPSKAATVQAHVSSATLASTPTGGAVTDFPAPADTPPDAALAYAAGLSGIRDAALERALTNLKRAVELDPTLAPAHLRLAIWTDTIIPPTESRAHYRAALENAHRLSPRDRELLDAIDPGFHREPPDLGEVQRRLEAIAQRRPNDVELVLLGIGVSGSRTKATDYDAVLRLDPKFAYAWWGRANAQFRINDTAGARASIDQCLDATPSSTLCVLLRARVDAREGRCDEMEKDARLVVALENGGETGYAHLANALASRAADRPAVEQAIHARARAAKDERKKKIVELAELAQTAAAFGDLTQAAEHARALEDVVADEPFEQSHVAATTMLVDVLQEMGDVAGAGRAAETFLRRRAAWRSVAMRPYDEPSPFMLAASERAGLRTKTDVARARDEWTATWRAKPGSPMTEEIWLQGWARPARDAADLEAAARVMPDAVKEKTLLPSPPGWVIPVGFANAHGARVQVAAGHVREGLATLESVTRHCSILNDAITHRRALLWTGQAYEAAHEPVRACESYGALLRVWGEARPRSVSVEAARARVSALHCAR